MFNKNVTVSRASVESTTGIHDVHAAVSVIDDFTLPFVNSSFSFPSLLPSSLVFYHWAPHLFIAHTYTAKYYFTVQISKLS